jgi:hypothetical protein
LNENGLTEIKMSNFQDYPWFRRALKNKLVESLGKIDTGYEAIFGTRKSQLDQDPFQRKRGCFCLPLAERQ